MPREEVNAHCGRIGYPLVRAPGAPSFSVILKTASPPESEFINHDCSNRNVRIKSTEPRQAGIHVALGLSPRERSLAMQQYFELETAPHTAGDGFLDEVLNGLSLAQKALPSRFLYDAQGSDLFERITELPEYYPTRTEIALLKACAPALRESLPSGVAIVQKPASTLFVSRAAGSGREYPGMVRGLKSE